MIVSGAIDEAYLRAAQDAANELNALYPEGGWDLRRKDLWRQVYACEEPRIVALVADILDPLALEIVDTVATPDRIQFASALPGFSTPRDMPRFLHIDGGRGPSLAAFNFLFGVALTPVTSDTAGGFHVLPGSHDWFGATVQQPTDQPTRPLGRTQDRRPGQATRRSAHGRAAPAARRHHRLPQLPGARHIIQYL